MANSAKDASSLDDSKKRKHQDSNENGDREFKISWNDEKAKQYADFTVKCGKDIYRIHKAIVCQRSEFFANLCKPTFKEGLAGEIVLKDEEPETVRFVMHYFYHDDYIDKSSEEERYQEFIKAHPFSLHAKVHILADKWLVDGLKELSAKHFIRSCDDTGKRFQFQSYDKTKQNLDLDDFLAASTAVFQNSAKDLEDPIFITAAPWLCRTHHGIIFSVAWSKQFMEFPDKVRESISAMASILYLDPAMKKVYRASVEKRLAELEKGVPLKKQTPDR